MNTNWKSGIAALVGLAAVAWPGLDRVGSAGTLQMTNDPPIECNAHDPLSPCAANLNFGYPVGDGLVVTLSEDFF
jgi:hypothetical protein